MPVSITGLSAAVGSSEGGTIITITASGLTAGTDLGVYLGTAGNDTDPPCYGGQGYGYTPQSVDGQTVNVATPPLDPGSYTLTLVQGPSSDTIAFTVVERAYYGRRFSIRKSFPSWVAAGNRRLDLEEGQ